ncbi:MAG: MBL fold metallo-hydrolase, partial [Microcystaceae cyanobacterium]
MPQRRSPAPNSLLSCFAYGVGHGGEGVCLLLRLGPYRILLDCGLRDLTALLTGGTAPADAVICSHAHGDHAQGLYDLHAAFPTLPIYASEVTTQLISLNWPQCAGNLDFCQPLGLRSPLKLFDNLTVELLPAGHLPGASLISLSYELPQRTYKVLYTGDFCLSNLQLVEGLSLEQIRNLSPDVLILESGYGTRRHPHRRQQEKQFMILIDQALQQGRNVLLPVPPLGLGQEILKLLRSHHQFTGRDLDIWVGGEVIKGCDRYLELLTELPLSVQNFAKHQPLFWDERVCPRLRILPEQLPLNITEKPCIIITDQWENLWSRNDWPQGNWTILLPENPT